MAFPHLLEADDYQPMLKLLADYQSTIQHPQQMKPFIKIVKIMLNEEAKLKAMASSPITESFCTEHWRKIMEFAFKQAATDKIQAENLNLIGELVERQVSNDFIKTMIIDIMSNIRKSNHSIALLISIFRGVNVDVLDGIQELKISIINWLSTKVNAAELKRVIADDSSLDKRLVAELYVLCILSRQGESIEFVKRKSNMNADQDEYRSMIQDLERNLEYRTLSNLIVNDLKKSTTVQNLNKLPERNEIKAVINESMNAQMEAALHSDDNFGSDNNSDFNLICSSLATYVNILNCFLEYETMDKDALNSSNMKKRISIRIGQLNEIVGRFANSLNVERHANDVNEIVDQLLMIWNDRFHPAVAEIIFTSNNEAIINWLLRQLKSSRLPSSLVMMPFKALNELEFEYRIQLKCLTLLAHFSAWDETDELAFDGISDYEFDLKRNEDLFMIFELVKVSIELW